MTMVARKRSVNDFLYPVLLHPLIIKSRSAGFIPRKKKGALYGNKYGVGDPGGGRKSKFNASMIATARQA
jgi:hypothetical protein